LHRTVSNLVTQNRKIKKNFRYIRLTRTKPFFIMGGQFVEG